jgi:hypothetical protein
MARISATIIVPVAPEVAFDHVADFTTTPGWDPSIRSAERLDAGPLGVGARFAVQFAMGARLVPLVYTITVHDRPDRVVLETTGRWHRGRDDVRFLADPAGTRIEWEAEFALRGPGRLIDPLLGVGFRRTAAAAVAGLERALSDPPAA